MFLFFSTQIMLLTVCYLGALRTCSPSRIRIGGGLTHGPSGVNKEELLERLR